MATLSVSRAAYGLCALLAATPAAAQYIDGSPPPLPAAPLGAENPADALARNVRILAQSPRDYKALVGAGRAALATGDAEVAVGFFGRAADVWPSAAAPKAGMGAALVAMGEASHALTEFERAARLGATVSSFALDRGLARDLLGQQALAQADYTIALAGPDPDEARRRLALSQAISGNRVGALATLVPLAQRHDSATVRVRAFVAALGGDTDGADRTLEANMPGMASHLDPFFRRLASLSPAQKAAAVHLGIIPSGAGGLASAIPLPSSPFASAMVPPLPTPRPVSAHPPAIGSLGRPQPSNANRLGGIEALLKQPVSPLAAPSIAPQQAALNPIRTLPPALVAAPAPSRVWVQLASGLDEGALGAQFARLAARKPDLFTGIRPFVSTVGERTKLLIGPFKDRENSEIFVEELADAQITGFSWVSPAGQPVRKLAAP
jgi:Flp pilus assembly protein TadD